MEPSWGPLRQGPRPSRVKPLTAEKIKQVVHMTLHEKPPNATHWSVRSMAKMAGISYNSVQRIWHAHGLKPHLVRTSPTTGESGQSRAEVQLTRATPRT